MRQDIKEIHLILPLKLFEVLKDISDYESDTVSYTIKRILLENEKVKEMLFYLKNKESNEFLKEELNIQIREKIFNDDYNEAIKYVELLNEWEKRYILDILNSHIITKPLDKITNFLLFAKCNVNYYNKYIINK